MAGQLEPSWQQGSTRPPTTKIHAARMNARTRKRLVPPSGFRLRFFPIIAFESRVVKRRALTAASATRA